MFRRFFGGSGKKHPLERESPQIHPLASVNPKEQFTKRSARVLARSQQIAEGRKDKILRTEHLLLALFREEGGIASKVIHQLGPCSDTIESVIDEMMTPPTFNRIEISLAEDVKQVLESAVDEARRQNLTYIGTEHLILGVMRQPKTVAFQILHRLGITPPLVRGKVRELLIAQSAILPDSEQPPDSQSSE